MLARSPLCRPYFTVGDPTFSTSAKAAGAILSPTAFGLALDIMSSFENEGQGVSFKNGDTLQNNFTMNSCVGFLILDIIWMSILGWYVDAVLPARFREFGVPRPLWFPFTPAYWREVTGGCCGRSTVVTGRKKPLSSSSGSSGGSSSSSSGGGVAQSTALMTVRAGTSGARAGPLTSTAPTTTIAAAAGAGATTDSGIRGWLRGLFGAVRGAFNTHERLHNGPFADASFMEAPDAALLSKQRDGLTVELHALRKEFDTPDGIKVAVDDLDLIMYESQITIILGPNGSGKTTAISMLTGLLEPTDGRMEVLGKDVATQLSAVREDLGVCPQIDVLWPDLTVKETLELYAALKGGWWDLVAYVCA